MVSFPRHLQPGTESAKANPAQAESGFPRAPVFSFPVENHRRDQMHLAARLLACPCANRVSRSKFTGAREPEARVISAEVTRMADCLCARRLITLRSAQQRFEDCGVGLVDGMLPSMSLNNGPGRAVLWRIGPEGVVAHEAGYLRGTRRDSDSQGGAGRAHERGSGQRTLGRARSEEWDAARTSAASSGGRRRAN